MRMGKSMMLGAALVLAACGGNTSVEDTEYVEATPDLAGTALEINGDAATEEGAKLIAEGFGVSEGALNGQGPEFLEGARMQVKAVNAALKEAIAPIVELVNAGGAEAQPGDVLVYGPQDRANATFLFTIKKVSEQRFVWKLQARPLGSTDDAAYKVVAAGGLTKALGQVAHRGRGTIGVNLDNLKAVVPTFAGQGKLMASFAHTLGNDKTLAYRLANFTPNLANHEPVTGAFVGHRRQPSGATRVRVFGKYNLKSTATAEKENVFATIRFIPTMGGRADIFAAGGDIAADKFYIGSACWDRQEMEKFRILRQCTKGQPLTECVVVEQVGTRDACPGAELRGEIAPPAGDPNDGAQEPDAPAEPEPVPADVTPEV